MPKFAESSVIDLKAADPVDASTVNSTDGVSFVSGYGGQIPCSSRQDYDQKMHSLMTTQPKKMGKSLSGRKLISPHQHMYDETKARNPSLFTHDGRSKLLMTSSKNSTNTDDSGSNETGESAQGMWVQGGKV